jgi:hypothetical protein
MPDRGLDHEVGHQQRESRQHGADREAEYESGLLVLAVDRAALHERAPDALHGQREGELLDDEHDREHPEGGGRDESREHHHAGQQGDLDGDPGVGDPAQAAGGRLGELGVRTDVGGLGRVHQRLTGRV